MTQATANIQWAGHTWELRPDHTIYWAEAETLILADPHFGKAQFFRGAGIPVPAGTTQNNLEKIDRAIDQTQAKSLVILGDFFHSRKGVTDDLLDQLRIWRDSRADLVVINVRGNHDRQAGDPPADLNVQCFSGSNYQTIDPAITFAHEPVSQPNLYTLCGHLHPGVFLQGKGRSRLRTACFHFMPNTAVLPAFGAFTGMKMIQPSKSDRVFAVGPNQVTEVTNLVGYTRKISL